MHSKPEAKPEVRVAQHRKFINTLDDHYKFYEVLVTENVADPTGHVEFTWGRIGTKGQTQRISLNSVKAALRHAELKSKSKLAKGYVEVAVDTDYTVLQQPSFEETEETRDKFDAFLNSLKL